MYWHLIYRIEDQMSKEGVNFKTGVNVGKDISIDEIKNQYDAVVLAGGSEHPRYLPLEVW